MQFVFSQNFAINCMIDKHRRRLRGWTRRIINLRIWFSVSSYLVAVVSMSGFREIVLTSMHHSQKIMSLTHLNCLRETNKDDSRIQFSKQSSEFPFRFTSTWRPWEHRSLTYKSWREVDVIRLTIAWRRHGRIPLRHTRCGENCLGNSSVQRPSG